MLRLRAELFHGACSQRELSLSENYRKRDSLPVGILQLSAKLRDFKCCFGGYVFRSQGSDKLKRLSFHTLIKKCDEHFRRRALVAEFSKLLECCENSI